ncbi:PhzF family phenazine biosynthesis protein [Panacibacter ginsenosidivorans]|uniref:PhzF family phenazine biosynthesis protein n=1 Tax=Panacibacter ginsenosidivorans TaxID=1813871 RepID=A0A5B8VBL1_9BACT|nr:PhzF family phenazine biosynthesis protein [Panacibacter ginsenosidivorans]QEC68649.1 PhzF family phenazine biosynthesis protein [Panacibacter ginsenosidivorans]
MKLPVYKVDAFTDRLFGGNPAAVCPLEEWLPDTIMQSLGAENNLAETTFIAKENDHYHIRWFTPTVEVKLCGHATLATAHIFYTELGYTKDEIVFNSLSGLLKVSRKAEGVYTLDFPADKLHPVTDVPDAIFEGLNIGPVPVFKSSFDYLLVLHSQQQVEALKPDFKILSALDARGVIVTAKGDEADFVSRCFFPPSGIDEDPVTGSAHTCMTPYWSAQLNKTSLKAIQVSKRRGYLDCELKRDRVLISGSAVTYLKGEYYLDL